MLKKALIHITKSFLYVNQSIFKRRNSQKNLYTRRRGAVLITGNPPFQRDRMWLDFHPYLVVLPLYRTYNY